MIVLNVLKIQNYFGTNGRNIEYQQKTDQKIMCFEKINCILTQFLYL
ncbi:hypothetical protein DI53_1419 [Sphingobacterium deserti]|uniref:Uncharacterized protein n=1 Tax=Sphingobacterium deserti TaxID=1229276 RepID=A0A0B8T8E0_9SPHI|nr:hypothetical protein DI53_1419 [Sphingobacterium deserti]